MALYYDEYYECGTCEKEFPAGRHARDEHCRAKRHSPPKFECDTCCRWFGDEKARHQHMSDKNHFYQSGFGSGSYGSVSTVRSPLCFLFGSLVTRL